MTPILELVDVWKAYDGFQALQGLSLKAYQSEVFGLVGPNGAGKTTTLKIVVGLLKTDKGLVRVGEYNIEEQPYVYKKAFGYVPEAVSLPDYLTVEEFLSYCGKIRAVANEQIREETNHYIRLFELEDKRKTLILFLSRGMRQKTAIASALIHDPQLLILDEPFVGIDPAGQHRMKELFSERIADEKAVLVSTHMLDTAERMCNRVAIVHKGRNVASGDLKELQRVSETGENATLEEVFLKLTEEAREPYIEKAFERRRQGIFRIFGRTD